MVDCYMSLNVPYAIEIAKKCMDADIDITWWEECLHPDDFDGHRLLKKALPTVKWCVYPSLPPHLIALADDS